MKFLRSILAGSVLMATGMAKAQVTPLPQAQQWVDSVMATLNEDERIAQLMVIRTSGMDGKGGAVFYDAQVDNLVKNYNVGGVCLFQGAARQQAALLNRIQKLAKTPIMVTVDGEWGLGMRFAGIRAFPYQLTMGAMNDADLVYDVGRAIAEQCRRMNIHVNYAPVVDINNNPANPVIGYRSFGEDRYKVALMGTRMMQGLQDLGVMACAKHFPGHGDVSVDSHYDLPVITKSFADLDSLELYPFRELFAKGVGSVMVAHLAIPAIDNTANLPTSLSRANITGLMREKLGFTGLTFTDALEMKGVAKFYPAGEAAVMSLLAGNDMLCLPEDVPAAIAAVKKAVASGRLSREAVDEKCRRVLLSKYLYVAGRTGPVDPMNLDEDLNRRVAPLRRAVAEKAFTLLKRSADWKPVDRQATDWIYVQIGGTANGVLADQMRRRGAQVLYSSLGGAEAAAVRAAVEKSPRSKVIVAVMGLGRQPANRFGLGADAIALAETIAGTKSSALLLMGNPYALGPLQNAAFETVAVGYEDDAVFQQAGYDWLTGLFEAQGTLPVTVGTWRAGTGLPARLAFEIRRPEELGMNSSVLNAIDTVARVAIDSGATPGCVVTVLRQGHIVFQKAYGHTTYERERPVSINTIYDLASVTKTSATTVAVMKLYEEGKLNLQAPIGQYLPWLRGSDKEALTVENLLLHQAGLVSFIPFYREVIDAAGAPRPAVFAATQREPYTIPVTDRLFMNRAWRDSIYQRILRSPVDTSELKYVYSDNNFILLADIVEAVSGKPVDKYAEEVFYEPLGMASTGYKAFERFSQPQIAPTEREAVFRRGLIWGYVHDPGAAMLGNVAGHAGLFSNATDLAKLYQMLLNGGEWEGRRYLKPSTIELFTSYQSPISRRGLGFDKPEKDNDRRTVAEAYPASFVSPATYGHTGFTGTCVWVDPAYDLVYIFLSNRVYPQGGDNRRLLSLNIRGRIHDIIYRSMGVTRPETAPAG